MSLEKKYQKLNEQRFATIVILCNVLDTEKGVSDHIKSAICASLINILERSMNDEDEPLVNLINNSIDNFFAVVEAKKDNFEEGWGQCLAELIAAQKLNGDQNNRLFGIVSNRPLAN